MDWSNEKCLQMIELYHNKRCLWDPTFDDYKNKLKKEDAWKEIAKQVECSPDDAQKKMDSLLASFRRERQKCYKTKSGSGADNIFKSKWFAYTSMQFLMGKYKPRKKTLDTTNSNSTNEQSENRNTQSPDHTQDSNNTQSQVTIEPGTSGMTQSQNRPSEPRQKIRRTKDPPVSEAYNILKGTYQSKIRDRSQIFGNHVASKHREYSQRTKSFVEHYINNILFDADMGKYESIVTPSSSYSDNPPGYQSPNYHSSKSISDYVTVEEPVPLGPESQPDYQTVEETTIQQFPLDPGSPSEQNQSEYIIVQSSDEYNLNTEESKETVRRYIKSFRM